MSTWHILIVWSNGTTTLEECDGEAMVAIRLRDFDPRTKRRSQVIRLDKVEITGGGTIRQTQWYARGHQ